MVVPAIPDAVGIVCDVRGGRGPGYAPCPVPSDGRLLCDDCIKGHECYRSNPDAVLAVVRSPRVGMYSFESPSNMPLNW